MARGRKHGAISKARRVPATRLAPVLKKLKQKLMKRGVPKVRLPTNDALHSYLNANLVEWLDWEKVEAWLEQLAATLK